MADKEPLKSTSPELACSVWQALAEADQNIPGLNRRLNELGYKSVAKSTFYRWRDERTIPVALPTRIVRSAAMPAATPDTPPIDLSGIPQDLIEALGIGVVLVAKGRGLDRLEDAVIKVADAIGSKAPQIAELLLATEREVEEVKTSGETVSSKTTEAANAARSSVQALMICADVLHRIATARSLPSLARRNFGEAERLFGEGQKYQAEAETLRSAARADGAKDITPREGGYTDAETEDEALAAMRDVESR